MLVVVSNAWHRGVAIQSDWARVNGAAVAAAASLGYITTETPEGFGRVWRPTAIGLNFVDREAQ